MKRQRFFGACSSHTASWASCAGCSARALGRPSPFYADTAYASTTPRRITSPKLGATRCSNSDPRNDHNELFAVTGPVARQCTPHRSQPPTTGRMLHRHKHAGSASEARTVAQVAESLDNDGVTEQPD
jgi:hypothetical protein